VEKRLFAWFMRRGDPLNHRIYAKIKREWFHYLNGRVLDLGAGSGLNIQYAPAQVQSWIFAEPNTAFTPTIQEYALNTNIPTEILPFDAHSIPLPDESVDALVATLILCSVTDPQKVISEIMRVLKPGGYYVFIEHVASEKVWTRRAQNGFNPISRWIADGCNCNRETRYLIETAGFERVELKEYHLREMPIFHRPHIAGMARKSV
jgi:ubiquinone/menaquinone biosynthesis C-methylase UbiE